MPELDRDTARDWIERWDRQQEESLPDREDRFTALIDAVEEGPAVPTRSSSTSAAAPARWRSGCSPGCRAPR